MSFAYNNMINVIGDIMAQYKIAVDADTAVATMVQHIMAELRKMTT